MFCPLWCAGSQCGRASRCIPLAVVHARNSSTRQSVSVRCVRSIFFFSLFHPRLPAVTALQSDYVRAIKWHNRDGNGTAAKLLLLLLLRLLQLVLVPLEIMLVTPVHRQYRTVVRHRRKMVIILMRLSHYDKKT